MPLTVTLIAVNGITLARKKGRHSVFLCSLESCSTLKCSDLVIILSHWRDFLNSQDLSRQLYMGQEKRDLPGSHCQWCDDGCCQGKETKSLQAIGRSPSKRRERIIQENNYFATAVLLSVLGLNRKHYKLAIEASFYLRKVSFVPLFILGG